MGCSGSPSFFCPFLILSLRGRSAPVAIRNPWLPCVSGAAKLAEGSPPIDPKTSPQGYFFYLSRGGSPHYFYSIGKSHKDRFLFLYNLTFFVYT